MGIRDWAFGLVLLCLGVFSYWPSTRVTPTAPTANLPEAGSQWAQAPAANPPARWAPAFNPPEPEAGAPNPNPPEPAAPAATRRLSPP